MGRILIVDLDSSLITDAVTEKMLHLAPERIKNCK
jgi:hypothetical protein